MKGLEVSMNVFLHKLILFLIYAIGIVFVLSIMLFLVGVLICIFLYSLPIGILTFGALVAYVIYDNRPINKKENENE
jgi:hypothetical protein